MATGIGGQEEIAVGIGFDPSGMTHSIAVYHGDAGTAHITVGHGTFNEGRSGVASLILHGIGVNAG